MPYIAGKGGKGPPNTADAPPWVDIYDRTKDPDQVPHSFVRSDEIPGVKVLPPNQLGPAPFYDEHGNEIPYVELTPKSGVWVPQSDFPGAKMYSPGVTPNPLPPYGYDEWLPGSGIYLWHGDMIPEPYNPIACCPGRPHRNKPRGHPNFDVLPAMNGGIPIRLRRGWGASCFIASCLPMSGRTYRGSTGV